MPINTKHKVGELLDAARAYFETTGRRVSIEYALIRDMNDHAWRADLLARELNRRGRGWVHVNPIPLNPTPGSIWTASDPRVEHEFVRTLREAGIATTVRDTRGRDIDGACGQLAAQDLVQPRQGSTAAAGPPLVSGDLFERTGRLRKGYHRDQVEDFLARAKGVWDAGGPPGPITSWHVRTVGFDMRRDGYVVGAVDSALDRIEDAFVSREERSGPASWREAEDAVLARLERDAGHRFPRATGLRAGLQDRRGGRPVPPGARAPGARPARSRSTTSGPRCSGSAGARAGYRETAVDAYLDRVVDVMRRRGSY